MNRAESVAVESIGQRKRVTRFAEFAGLAVIFAQVGLIALILRYASIETLAFHRVFYIAAFGFVVNHLLPARIRPRFFLTLSIISMVVALGGSAGSRTPAVELGIARSSLILGVGVALIAICHFKIGFWKKAIVLLGAGLIVAVNRSAQGNNRVTAVIWPVLAALFMFRIIAYLYDISTSSQRPTATQSLTYFYLTPNFCALLFPVIDFRTFCQTYYSEEALVIYQRGVRWMTRGIIQLLVYRLIHQLFAIDVSDVVDGTDLIRFVVTNVFLYLKISGSFHFYIGLLLLFGFNLPETNHRYFLAASFTDYWRRVNIYWRAFIMKVFYYPMFFRFKNFGQAKALIVATLWCFLVTWAFHIYQTWWITGAVSWSWPDALFWTALGLLVLANSLLELRRSKRRKLVKGVFTLREAIGVTVRTISTFAVITVLWSLWSTPTLTLWFHIWGLADLHTLAWGCAMLACIGLATVIFEILPANPSGASGALGSAVYPRSAVFLRDALKCSLPLCAIFVATHLPAKIRSDPDEHKHHPIATLVVQNLLDADVNGHGRGYYENLTSVDEGSSQFWETMTTKFNGSFALSKYTFSNESNVPELMPNVHIQSNGIRIDTNRWGMRDRDRAILKPPDTLRIAILGSSHVMGYGLPSKDMFEPLLEARLNSNRERDATFEVMNFSVTGQGPAAQTWMLQHRVPNFRPDLVIFFAHLVDFEWANTDVLWSLHRKVGFPADFPTEVFAQAGVTGRTFVEIAIDRLKPYEGQILSYDYRQIVRECQSIGALPICVILPVPTDLPVDHAKASDLLHIAANAGFVTIDFSEIYAGYRPEDLMLGDIGRHSNARAHSIIANALYGQLTTDPRIDLLGRARRIREISANVPVAAKTSD